jgi:hypothetical protein
MLVYAILASAVVSAQEFSRDHSVHVLDLSGGAVPNAKTQVLSAATGEATSAVSDSSGAFSLPLLRPGTYKLTAMAQGSNSSCKITSSCRRQEWPG